MSIAFLIPLMAMAFAAGAFYWRKQLNLQRTKDMDTLASNLNLPFYEKDVFGLSRQLQDFELFRRERSSWFRNGKVTNVIKGQTGDTEYYLFDYSYYIQTNNSRRKITQTVFFANNKNWYLPSFHLKPETWWHKVLQMMGKKDINFPENPIFSDHFWLTGEFDDLIREKFTPEVREYITDHPPAHIEGNNYYMIAYKPRKTMNPEEARGFLAGCLHLVELFRKQGPQDLLQLAEVKEMEKEMRTDELKGS